MFRDYSDVRWRRTYGTRASGRHRSPTQLITAKDLRHLVQWFKRTAALASFPSEYRDIWARIQRGGLTRDDFRWLEWQGWHPPPVPSSTEDEDEDADDDDDDDDSIDDTEDIQVDKAAGPIQLHNERKQRSDSKEPTPADDTKPIASSRLMSSPREIRDLIYDCLPEITWHLDGSQSGYLWIVTAASPAIRLANHQLRAEFDDHFLRNCTLHLSDHHEMEARKDIAGPPKCALNSTVFTADVLVVYTERSCCITHSVYLELKAHRKSLTTSITALTKLRKTTLRVFLLISRKVLTAFHLLVQHLDYFSSLTTVSRVEVLAYEGERTRPRDSDPRFTVAIWPREDDGNGEIQIMDMDRLAALARKAEIADRKRGAARGGNDQFDYVECYMPDYKWGLPERPPPGVRMPGT